MPTRYTHVLLANMASMLYHCLNALNCIQPTYMVLNKFIFVNFNVLGHHMCTIEIVSSLCWC